VARCLRRIQRLGNPGKRWLAFLQNHREVIVAFDIFTVPTVPFQLLYCFFVMEHGRRKILSRNYRVTLWFFVGRWSDRGRLNELMSECGSLALQGR
jgi:hypothetical protein